MANQKGTEKKMSVRNQSLIAILASIPGLFYGLLAGWLSPAIPQLQSIDGPSSVPLSDIQISAIGSCMTIGAMFGVVVYAWMVDRFGRKTTLFCLSIPFAVGWAMKLLSSEFYVLLAARFIAGMSGGATFVIIPLYIKEISHSSCRGILCTLFTVSLNAGYIMSYALGGYTDYYINLCIYLSLPLIHMVLFFFFGLESPSYLVKQGRCEDAGEAIAWLNGLEPTDKRVILEVEEIKAEHDKAASEPKVSFKSIANNQMTLETLKVCVGLIMVHSLCGAFALMSYASMIYQPANIRLDPNMQAVITGCTQLSGCLVTSGLIDKLGRKVILTTACIIAVMGYVLLGVWFTMLDFDVELPGWIPLVAASACIFSYGLGTNPLPFVIISEVFDYKTRATLSGYLLVYCWFNDSVVLMGFNSLSNLLGMGVVFFMFASVNLFGMLLAIIRLPETKGKSVEKIQLEVLERKKQFSLPCCRK